MGARLKKALIALIASDKDVRYALGKSAKGWLNSNIVDLMDHQRHADKLYNDIIGQDDTQKSHGKAIEACLTKIEQLEQRVSDLEGPPDGLLGEGD